MNMEDYNPPFTITNEMIEKVSLIMEKIGKLDNFKTFNKKPILRRNTKIYSVHSSLAIEANTLSLNQVNDVINGKIVIGPQNEIQEVKNAYKAYGMINEINPYDENDFLKVHSVMTFLTIKDSGIYRKGNEGVFDENDNCIFVAPGPEKVPYLMHSLFLWLNKNKESIHPLILSSVFHYECVFIHPFSDGNGRMARLWQNTILSKWKEIFEFMPIESQIRNYQVEYYKAIDECNNNGDSNSFIIFMLKMIDKVIDKLATNLEKEQLYENSYISKLLEIMVDNVNYKANDLMNILKLKSINSFRKNYLNPAIQKGIIKMTLPSKPTSKNQMYYKG